MPRSNDYLEVSVLLYEFLSREWLPDISAPDAHVRLYRSAEKNMRLQLGRNIREKEKGFISERIEGFLATERKRRKDKYTE